ncbi:uncharacterized protein Z519_10840 [Cladophialophora bantiana CBS 173.52]|uniref:Uncharacterized protein n=1 Tax=Cladophialophora bantiana (strain ATCC 10958 / CBS 173.52 / CDC B-1940 / NIH 8579) TaxID=1442370 RepID=A0A0D2H640_CLAB1|nr:uncharacterized protein Z519_10840 [Cladophialophora bantiana CBS 173.52]KIW88793.1 hypothetical protein Z519_10840 [Cladophialophora bantiana CBS 173.52]
MIVSKEQFDAAKAELLKESPDHVLLLKTPADDARPTEELLGIEKGNLPDFTCRFVKGSEHCSQCSRHYSFLDFVKAGLQTHDQEFLRDAIFGRHGGYIRTEGGHS